MGEMSEGLVDLPDTAIISVLNSMDAKSLKAISETCTYFRDTYMPVSGLKLTEHVARKRLLECHDGDESTAERFKYLSWRERLYLDEDAGCGFDERWLEASGFRVEEASLPKKSNVSKTIRLTDMGPKLLYSNASTRDQDVLHWRLRVTGNTAVEFGVIPVMLEPNQNSLHKTDFVKGDKEQRCIGFCSQITAGSHLPVKVPVVRGTIVDLVAQRGVVQIVLMYPRDAQEIKWNREGQPVPSPYQGPRALRFELEYASHFDVKLAVTCWAKASFDILHVGMDKCNSGVDIDVVNDGANMEHKTSMDCEDSLPSYNSTGSSSQMPLSLFERTRSAPDLMYEVSADSIEASKEVEESKDADMMETST
jgi:hypothetical protein